jgi:hypothetical protein
MAEADLCLSPRAVLCGQVDALNVDARFIKLHLELKQKDALQSPSRRHVRDANTTNCLQLIFWATLY